MRLFRRTLLCLVVGVAAFGVAGRVFRLKPNWEVECGPAIAEVRLLAPQRALATDEPIWIRRTVRTDAEPIDTLTVHDSRTGQELRHWTLTYNEGRHEQYFGAPGKLIATCSGNQTTKFRVFDADTGAVVEHELPAYWAPGGGGTSAWRFEQRVENAVLHIVDLVSGKITSRALKSPSGRLFGRQPNGDLSPDGRRFAARLTATGGAPSTPTLQIWSIDPPTLLQQAKPPIPENTSVGQIDLVHWIDSGRFVEVKVCSWNQPDDQPHKHERWLFDPATSQFSAPPIEQSRGFSVPGADAEVVKEYHLTAWSFVPTALLERLPESRAK